MRQFFLLLGLLAVGLMPAFGQNTIPGNNRTSAPEAAPVPSVVPLGGSGKVISADSQLVPMDAVSIRIVDDNEPPWKTIVTDSGMVELGNLGNVKVSGMTANGAASAIRNYLLKDYYKKVTVEVVITQKALSAQRPDKVTVAGKVGRPGPQYFNAANPLTLSEAVIMANTSVYSNLKNVQLTRGGVKQTINVEGITKGGQTNMDIQLRDGDQVYVFEKGIVFGN